MTSKQESLLDDYRATLRTISDIIHEIYDKHALLNKEINKPVLSLDNFQTATLATKQFRAKFSKSDILDIYDSCDIGISTGKVTVDELIDFVQKTI